MDFITILLIAIGLSFDTFAVSVSTGLTISHIRFWQALRMAVILAFFQALMPLIGWLAGRQMEALISDYDHWIAFTLLALLGFKMIYESLKDEKAEEGFNPLKLTVLIGIAIATSIDALVVGVSFAFISMNIYWSILIIGVVTFLVSMIGIFFGKKVGNRLGKFRREKIACILIVAIINMHSMY